MNVCALRNLVVCLEAQSPQIVLNLTKAEMNFMETMWEARNPGTQLVFYKGGFIQQKEGRFTGWISKRYIPKTS